ncbi:MAG: hypothetical protein JNN24_01940 [Hyphomicrobium zavarzinii]|nr:hypothetical protein [Hyphomicrobium zavarzinii]
MSERNQTRPGHDARAEGMACANALAMPDMVRARLQRGDVTGATLLLGQPWGITATVVHGDKRGRALGFATANLVLSPDTPLAHGVYAVRATVRGACHEGVACFGTRPQFDDGAPRLEVHLFDFDHDIYGASMNVAFVAFQRPEMKFVSVDALKEQMATDCRMARELLREGIEVAVC